MRTDKGTDGALDAELLVPHRDVYRNVALLVLRCGGREGAVDRHGGNRQIVAEAGDDWTSNLLDKLRSVL